MINKKLREHVLKLLNANSRLDGRTPLQYRNISIEANVVKTAEGSARVRIGDTQVIVGVKLEVGKPYPDTPDQGGIIVGAELLPLSNPEYELGPPGIDAIELARVVDRAIRESKAIDFKALCITPGEKVWNVIIDACPINDDGNLFDACSLGALAAIKATALPKYENDVIDYKEKTSKKLKLDHEPISVTIFKMGDKFFVDPNIEEQKVYDGRLTVGVMENSGLCSLQKGGEGSFTQEDIKKMVDIAVEKAAELRKLFK